MHKVDSCLRHSLWLPSSLRSYGEQNANVRWAKRKKEKEQKQRQEQRRWSLKEGGGEMALAPINLQGQLRVTVGALICMDRVAGESPFLAKNRRRPCGSWNIQERGLYIQCSWGISKHKRDCSFQSNSFFFLIIKPFLNSQTNQKTL